MFQLWIQTTYASSIIIFWMSPSVISLRRSNFDFYYKRKISSLFLQTLYITFERLTKMWCERKSSILKTCQMILSIKWRLKFSTYILGSKIFQSIQTQSLKFTWLKMLIFHFIIVMNSFILCGHNLCSDPTQLKMGFYIRFQINDSRSS